MNIGLDFNTKTTKAAFLVNGISADDCEFIEIKNILVFSNSDIYVGHEGFNKFLTEKDSQLFDLEQIIEWNGIIFNKRQVSVEKCLSTIFSHLIRKIQTRILKDKIDFICISIPYDKYYYWHDLIKKAFSLIGVEKLRIISQPTAFFGQPNIDYLHSRLNRKELQIQQHNLLVEQKSRDVYNQAFNKYLELPWYKKFLSKKPVYEEKDIIKIKGKSYLFVSISQDNTNASLVDFGDGILQIVSTQYTNVITRRKIEIAILNYFVSEIEKDSRNFVLNDKKTLSLILEEVNGFLRTPHNEDTYELNLPYILCKDRKYRTLDMRIDLNSLKNFLTPIFNSLTEIIEQLANATQEAQKQTREEYRRIIGNIIVIGDLFIQQSIETRLYKIFSNTKIALGNQRSLAIGAYNFSKVFTGENNDYLALEVIPFSVLVRLSGGEFIEMIKKDSTVPTCSKEHCFTIESKNKTKFIEVHLTTKESDNVQSLSVWKVQPEHWKVIRLSVDIGADMKISLKACPQDSSKPFNENEHFGTMKDGKNIMELNVQEGKTFSFGGAGFGVGIKGKDLQQYILNQFNYLNAVLDNREISIFEPNEIFYSMLSKGNPFEALRYLGYSLKLKNLPDVEMAESQFFEEQGIGGFISGSKISVPKTLVRDPHGFGYILAHELAHYILIHEEQIILDDEQENEILTEIFVVYSGMGKLFLNGFNSKDVESSSLNTRGYLDEKIIKYIHQIYFQKFNISPSTYKENLTKEAVKILEEFIN